MGDTKFKPGQGGRPKGVKNKTTVDIKAIIDKNVNWPDRVKNLVKLADAGNVQAEKMLWEYKFGKPLQEVGTPNDKPIEHSHTITASPKLLDLANKLAER